MQGQKKENPTEASSTNVEKVEQAEPIYLWAQNPDADGNPQWAMIPYYVEFFQQFEALLIRLNETLNRKWKPEQLTAYQTYLADVHSYIVDYIWTGQVAELNEFYAAMQQYGKLTNPLGKELYEIQIDYFQKVLEGYQFNPDKKKKKVYQKVQKKVGSERRRYNPDHPKRQKPNYEEAEGSDSSLEREPAMRVFTRQDMQKLEKDGFTVVGKPLPKLKEGQKKWHEKTHGRNTFHDNQTN